MCEPFGDATNLPVNLMLRENVLLFTDWKICIVKKYLIRKIVTGACMKNRYEGGRHSSKARPQSGLCVRLRENETQFFYSSGSALALILREL